MENVYTEIGGLRSGQSFWGSFNVTGPFVELTATPEDIVIKIKRFISSDEIISISSDKIDGVKIKKGIFSAGVQFIHHSENIAPFILFWSRDETNLIQNLIKLGYRELKN